MSCKKKVNKLNRKKGEGEKQHFTEEFKLLIRI